MLNIYKFIFILKLIMKFINVNKVYNTYIYCNLMILLEVFLFLIQNILIRIKYFLTGVISKLFLLTFFFINIHI